MKLGNRSILAAAAAAVLMGGGALAVTAVLVAGQAQAQASAQHPGRAVYMNYCADCHDDASNERAPKLANLQAMSDATLRAALTEGVMKPIADPIPRPQFEQLIAYLAKVEPAAARPSAAAAAAAPGRGAAPAPNVSWIEPNMCPADKRAVDLTGPKTLTSFGIDARGSRRMSAREAKLTNAQLGQLEVAWSLAIPGANNMGTQPVIIGSTMFYSAPTVRRLLALDTQTGCIKWAFEPTAGTLRSSVAFGQLGPNGPQALIFGDGQGYIQAVDAKTGVLIWRAQARAPIRGAPLIYKDKIIVPISGNDVGAAGSPQYECCKGHGAIVAMNAADGKQLWTWHTMEDAKPLGRKNSVGVNMFGPSGAPIWASPIIDAKRNAVIATTGENTSPPATATSDSVVSIDLDTGKANWIFQALQNDIWNMACPSGIGANTGPNCFFNASGESILKDYDFGAQAIVASGPGGKDVILAGQKSGDVWALDAVTGKVVWNKRFGIGTALGGVHWGIAADDSRVFAPINDPVYVPEKAVPGMNALDIKTGKVLWQWAAKADCADGRAARLVNCETKYGLSAAPIVIDKAVIAGSLDGKLWIFNAADGKVIAMHDTARAFETRNGIPGAGGAIDSHGVFAGDGMVFVGSGYGSFNQKGGNVLVAFRPKR